MNYPRCFISSQKTNIIAAQWWILCDLLWNFSLNWARNLKNLGISFHCVKDIPVWVTQWRHVILGNWQLSSLGKLFGILTIDLNFNLFRKITTTTIAKTKWFGSLQFFLERINVHGHFCFFVIFILAQSILILNIFWPIFWNLRYETLHLGLHANLTM